MLLYLYRTSEITVTAAARADNDIGRKSWLSLVTSFLKNEELPEYLLEFYYLELYMILPKISSLAQKALSKQKLSAVRPSLEQSIDKVRLSVVQNYGKGLTIFKFNRLWSKSNHKLKVKIEEAVSDALSGLKLALTIEDDTGLSIQVYS